MPSVFVLEHGRLWLVAQRGYAVVPDGITVESGITGRAVRLGTGTARRRRHGRSRLRRGAAGRRLRARSPAAQSAASSSESSTSSPSARFPTAPPTRIRPLARALAPLAEELRASRTLDLAALARLFVHLGSLREPGDIAALGAASLPKVLPVEASQIVVWDELGCRTRARGLAGRTRLAQPPLSLERARSCARPRPTRASSARSSSSRLRRAGRLAIGRLAPAPRECRRARRAGRDQSRRGSRGPDRPRHGRGARRSCRGVARRRVRSAARATERGHRSAHRHPQPSRPRGTTRARARRRRRSGACR